MIFPFAAAVEMISLMNGETFDDLGAAVEISGVGRSSPVAAAR
jgi:hypothetical protein